jgi:hypothetical protein
MTGIRIRRLLHWTVGVFVGVHGLILAGPDEHAARRAAVLGLMDTSAGMVLRSADMQMRNPDANFRYRQESNLLYLTGENKPGLTLLLVPRGVQVNDTVARALLFVREGSDE